MLRFGTSAQPNPTARTTFAGVQQPSHYRTCSSYGSRQRTWYYFCPEQEHCGVGVRHSMPGWLLDGLELGERNLVNHLIEYYLQRHSDVYQIRVRLDTDYL